VKSNKSWRAVILTPLEKHYISLNIMTNTHYPAAVFSPVVRRHTLSVIVDNEPGVLARIAGLFSGRGYNIESLTVSETEHEAHISRITVVTSGNEKVIEQIKAQLNRIVPVHRVVDLTVDVKEGVLERELCLVKVTGKGEHRVEAMRLASAFGAKTLDATLTSFIFELTGATDEVERFITTMTAVGLAEVSRTGIAAMGRGAEVL
jgi:acetolactate synthase I/III small subunit